ncbi:glutamyl-tRNA synthetase [Thelephora ganbajun]|uniref:Glutamyl-tRNA synthetase n=1 Tax=Thelephora ganbajun TaxID=370292 RepID=A0ACB6ZDV6_THEGA|nr:glutamyl-tRNA synthetase [Thelephora ganbajun]
MVLLRFAPSPTGALHLGGLKTALFNHLYARKLGGKWILRIEDTDTTRYVPGSVESIREALAWAGLDYDHGPVKGGPHQPYFQSERLDLYRTYAKKLTDASHAYRCFCSPDKLATTREKLARTGSNATYDKSCLNLTDEEVARRVKAGEKHVIRMNDGAAPARKTPDDIVFGPLKDAHASLPTDPVLLKSDLFPTYHLASVVDDHEMGITHVVRGEEWLPSLPLHLDLYASLGITPPRFAHLPLLLNPDGSKMSKRNGDVDVMEFMRRGWEPVAVLNWLALAGWGVKHDHSDGSSSSAKTAPNSTTVMTMQEMIQEFDLSALTHRRTILDPLKLEYLNKNHLMETWSQPRGLNALANRVIGSVEEAFPNSEYTTVDHIKRVILALQSRITNILDIAKLAPYFFVEPDYGSQEAESMIKSIPQVDIGMYFWLIWGNILVKILTNVVPRLELVESWTEDELATVLHDAAHDLGVGQKIFMTVLRHALSGMKTGPGVAEIMDALGKERSVVRLRGREIVS